MAIGFKMPKFNTQYVTYASCESLWKPWLDPSTLEEVDHDLLRKQKLESEE